MTLSQCFDECERINGKGSTCLIKMANDWGDQEAEIGTMIPGGTLMIIMNRSIVGLSRPFEPKAKSSIP